MLVEANSRLPVSPADGSFPAVPTERHRTPMRDPARAFGGSLFRCSKTASLAVVVLLSQTVMADAQDLLSAVEIEYRIVGHSFRGKKGILSVSLAYAPDGTVTMRSPLGAGTGSWTLVDNRLCVRIETGPRKANECMTFTRQSDGTLRASNGMRLTPLE